MRTRKVFAKGLSILMLTILILFGFRVSAHAAAISGTVRNDSNEPINGSIHEIQVTAFQGDPCGWIQWMGNASIDTTGAYTISDLPDGNYYVQTYNMNDHDYTNEWWTGDTDPSTYYCNNAQPVNLSGGDQTGIDFKLPLGGSVSGNVFESDGTTPIEGILMGAFTGQCGQNQVAWVNTDVNGAFTLRGIPLAGAYISACASCQGLNYVNKWWASGGGTIDCNAATPVTSGALEDFTLDAGGTLSGQVVGYNSVPQANVIVSAHNEFFDWGTGTVTGGNGQFQLSGIPPGGLEIEITPEVNTGLAWFLRSYYLDIGENRNLGTIRLQKGALVSGHINHDGAPLPEVEYYYGGRFEMGWGETAFATDPDPGYFEFRLPVGSYTLNIEVDSGYVMVPVQIDVSDVNATYDLDNLPVQGRPDRLAYDQVNGEQITGTVSGLGLPHNGQFVVAAFLDDEEITPDNAGAISPLGLGMPAPDYGLFVPPAADYDRNGRNIQVALVLLSESKDGTESITIVDVVPDVDPAYGDVDLTYASAGQTVQGYVKDTATSDAIFSATVLLYNQTGDVFTGTAETDSSGKYVFYNVPPNVTYKVAVTHPSYADTQWATDIDVVAQDVNVSDILMQNPIAPIPVHKPMPWLMLLLVD